MGLLAQVLAWGPFCTVVRERFCPPKAVGTAWSSGTWATSPGPAPPT